MRLIGKDRVRNMYIIVGLGNPGKEYAGTRHNIGFEVIDEIARQNGISMDGKKHKAIYGKGTIDGYKVILAKPQTYMNLSGESVRELTDFYKVNEEELIIIYDDISLDIGQLRIRKKGSAGGHNGIKSIISHLGTQEFTRIKVGVGDKPKGYDLADYVLGHFSKTEKPLTEKAVSFAAEAAKAIVTTNADTAMNLYNKKPEA